MENYKVNTLSMVSKVNPFLLLFLFIVTYGLIMVAYQTFILDNEIYFNHFSDQLSYERIEKMIEEKEQFKWLGFLLFMSMYSFKFVAISACIMAGFFAWNVEVGFSDVFKITILAEIIFLLRLVLKIVWFSFFDTNYNLSDLKNFQPASLLNFTDLESIEPWLRYPLSAINLFEILFIVIVSFFLKNFLSGSFKKTLYITFSSYGIALTLWITMMTFLSVLMS